MPALLSLVTSVKDYIEIAHKLVETQNTNFFLSGTRPLFQSGLTSLYGFGLENSTQAWGPDYNEFGAVLTYVVLSAKEFLANFLTFSWLKTIWSLPLVVPDVASAMISEISVLDSYFTNSFSFLENGLSTNLNSNVNTLSMATENLVNAQKLNQNPVLFGFEKFVIGFFNSFFLFLPTSTAHLITLRRFVVQGIEAGFIAGLGTIAGNFLWLASIILGLRFIVIPWLSLDIFRYVLGFMLLVKYLWDSSNSPQRGPNSSSKTKLPAPPGGGDAIQIFALNFLLAFTEQTSIYPFISNMSFGADGSIIAAQGFSNLDVTSGGQFLFFGIHACYLLGILLGSFSLLQFTVWFWENPAFSIYMWMISSYRVTTSSYYKVLNFVFLYLTMLSAISSIPYFGLDYTVTNPLGMIPQDRIIDQKSFSATGPGEPLFPEASFLGVKPTDKNSRIRDGVHARRERWKERLIKYQAFDTSLYDQGAYDILTVEDLNYGFDRFWLRRKMRNHQIRFRLFPGPWMRSVKKQLNKPGFTGPRTEFFRILFEQYYHPSFHATANKNKALNNKQDLRSYAVRQEPGGPNSFAHATGNNKSILVPSSGLSNGLSRPTFSTQKGLISEYSALRKFSKNVNTRLKAYSAGVTSGLSPMALTGAVPNNVEGLKLRNSKISSPGGQLIYSKSLKSLFNKINKDYTKTNLNLFRNLSKNLLVPSKSTTVLAVNNFSSNGTSYGKLPAWNAKGSDQTLSPIFESFKKTSMRKPLSKKERALLIYLEKSAAYAFKPTPVPKKTNIGVADSQGLTTNNPVSSLNFYFKKNEAFKRKLQYYSTAVTRKFSVGNNAPYFKTILKRAFYYHKPTLRLKRTMFAAAMRRGFRKKSVMPNKLAYTTNSLTTDPMLSTRSAVGTADLATTSLLSPSKQSLGAQATNSIYLPTQQYSVLGKRASRYRYQVYKDVLQHWYYTPFNRLLLKFDVDSFINRQPKSHFLTKKEERLLHLRRVLLADHYNTLRWYTYMQHYRTMKSRIGGTKSFASTAYNQQFQGTFKKIRHLFAITPIQGDMSILKFDQPLYTDSNLTPPQSRRGVRESPVLNGQTPEDVLSQGGSSNKTSEQLKTANTSRGTSKRKYGISPSRYAHEDLTKDSTKPSVNVGSEDIVTSNVLVNSRNLIDQSLNAAGTLVKAEQQTKYNKMREYINQKNYSALTNLLAGQEPQKSSFLPVKAQQVNIDNLNTDLVILDLLKEAKKRVNDQTFLKNYISHRIDKREQRNNETSKELRAQLETLKTWLSPYSSQDQTLRYGTSASGASEPPLFETTTGVRKALNDGVIAAPPQLNPSLQTKAFITKQAALRKFKESAGQPNRVRLTQSLIFVGQKQQIKETVSSIKKLTSLVDQIKTKASSAEKLKVTNLTKNVLSQLTHVQRLLNTVLKPFVIVQNKLLTKRTDKNLEWWRQKQRALNKRASSRKKERLNYLESNISSQQKQAPRTNTAEQAQTGYNSYLLPGATQSVTNKSFKLGYFKMPGPAERGLADTAQQGSLRKKTDSNKSIIPTGQHEEAMGLDYNSSSRPATKLFERFVLRKFRKKRSRGKSYRKPYYANIIRPKNASGGAVPTNSRDLVSNYLDNFTGILAPGGALAALQSDMLPEGAMVSNLAKEDKSVMFKLFKQNLAKTIASQAYSSSVSSVDVENNKVNSLKNLLIQSSIKKSPSKKRSKRTSRKRTRQKFSINHDRYRKRKKYGLGKLRNLAKKMKRIKSTQEFQNWWWNTYLPNYMTKQVAANFIPNTAPLGLSNSRYAPLSTTKALDIMGRQSSNSQISSSNKIGRTEQRPLVSGDVEFVGGASENERGVLRPLSPSGPPPKFQSTQNSGATVGSSGEKEPHILDKIYENLVESQAMVAPNLNTYSGGSATSLLNSVLQDSGQAKFNTTTTIPFYAGWDESLRKFVVTNRLLSRRDAGFEVNLNGIFASDRNKTQTPNVGQQAWQFTNAPINGLNEASFLYLQTEMPFNSYTIDQFIPNNQSFYAPLGWKRFQFRHSLLKNWLNNSKSSNNTAAVSNKSIYLTNNSISNFEYFRDPRVAGSLSSSPIQQQTSGTAGAFSNQNSKLQNRRIKKRYKLLRQTPIQLMYVPTGSLLTETLPSHYISVFDKQYRFPRNRYLKLFLKRTSNSFVKNQAIAELGSTNGTDALGVSTDFTLRKRIKPKRKYHKKRFTKKDGLIFPRRRKFGNIDSTNLNAEQFRLRPYPKGMRANQNLTKGAPKAKKQGRNSGKANAIRLRQLRRREFQQVFKPLQRYQPRNGGFTWPGDYLRLQIIPMPKLEPNLNAQVASLGGYDNAQSKTSSTPTKVKTKINSQPIGLLPRKYLLQKHNLKVFKKKIALKYGT